jgi:16S rRNA (cytidine1402-2'-O)-methyltransferase
MSKLYLVPTPIGNLEDITLRAIRILKEVDVILAEDTRTTGFLLQHYGIDKRMQPFHQHNEHKILSQVMDSLAEGVTMALVTDAGTPGISDPAFLIVRECVRRTIPVETLPGAVALIPALVNSGLPMDRFCFEGFLPHKKGRQTRLERLKEEDRTMIFYESPFRVLKSLEQFIETFGEDRPASVSRELTKKFEENFRGTLREVYTHFSSSTVKGEFVLVVAGKS